MQELRLKVMEELLMLMLRDMRGMLKLLQMRSMGPLLVFLDLTEKLMQRFIRDIPSQVP